MQPVVVTYNTLTSGGTASISASAASTSGPLVLATTIVGLNQQQQRITVTSAGNDTTIYFHIIGLNQARFTVAEYLAGGLGSGVAASAVTVQSNLDYRTIISIQPSGSSVAQTLATTAATVSAGTNGVGSTLWNIQNWHVTPTNIELSGVVISNGSGVNWGIQYTYDDPNNLPIGVQFPQPFNHPTLNNLTASLDGPSNDPITAWRLIINSGTGSVRATGIQAGIGGP